MTRSVNVKFYADKLINNYVLVQQKAQSLTHHSKCVNLMTIYLRLDQLITARLINCSTVSKNEANVNSYSIG